MDADARDGGRPAGESSEEPRAAASAAESWQSPPSPSSSSSAMAAPTDALSLYYDADSSAIDGGDMVGLADADLSVHSMGSAIGGMDMSMELSEQQIRAFLARNEHEVNSALAAQHAQEAGHAAVTGHGDAVVLHASTTVDGKSTVHAASTTPRAATSSSDRVASTAAGGSSASQPAVYYGSRNEKIRQVREHPLVASAAPDGRTVECKCGRNVRLNPPWYILKFEQHIVSRNCTYLRVTQPKSRSVQKFSADLTDATKAFASGRSAETTAHGSNASQNRPDRLVASNSTTSMSLEHGSESTKRQGTGSTDAFAGSVGNFSAEMHSDDAGAGSDGLFDSDRYALMSLEAVFARDFSGLVEEGALGFPDGLPPPPPPSSHALWSAGKMAQYTAMQRLQGTPHFSRITPDGRIIECTCLQLVVLSAPWNLSRFIEHTKHKEAPRKRVAAARARGTARSKKKLESADTEAVGVRHKPTMLTKSVSRGMAGESALRVRRKSFPQDIRWDAAGAVGILPCPGLRGEKTDLFVSTSVQLTGGGRPQHKIAQELFPHLFPPGEGSKQAHQLMDAEKLMLHDVIEGEAAWFVDKDGRSVRSLDCKGVIDTKKAETVCSGCAALRSNATLRTAIASSAKKAKTPRNPVNRKFCSGRVFSLLESEFDMGEEYARILRDLSLVHIPSSSPLNSWMQAAEMGIRGLFDSHPALIGLVESMVTLKDKERRGVGMQNMTYSDCLDDFVRSIAELSPEACELFQSHLIGRNQKALLGRKRRPPGAPLTADEEATDESQSDGHREVGNAPDHEAPGLMYESAAAAAALGQSDGFAHLLDASSAGMMPNLSISDIQDVDLAAFSNVAHAPDENQSRPQSESDHSGGGGGSGSGSGPTGSKEASLASAGDGEALSASDKCGRPDANASGAPSAAEEADEFLSGLATSDASVPPAPAPVRSAVPLGHVPCTGLRDDKVQCYVSAAVQVVGGSRPKYVIARELFPDVFGEDTRVKMTEKLSTAQRLLLQDAVFSECTWRVDKVGNCVRSLRCFRVADARSKGVCRACRDLKSIPNFRSLLCRSRVPKKLENIKYVPTTYTESDPFLRKLAKNAAFRALYQAVKAKAGAASAKKRVTFWLRCARMGIFGHFRSHPVFEGLVESMVEVKDKERRGVGKQNMQYSKPLDDFMAELSALSVEAFDLFTRKFCGRTLRSQKVVKRRKTQQQQQQQQQPQQPQQQQPLANPTERAATAIGESDAAQPHQLMPTDDLLAASRAMTASEMDESQRLMDRMLLDEMRMSVAAQDMLMAHAPDKQPRDGSDTALDPRTYLDAHGVLTSEI